MIVVDALTAYPPYILIKMAKPRNGCAKNACLAATLHYFLNNRRVDKR